MTNDLTKQFPGNRAFPEKLTIAQLVKNWQPIMESEGLVCVHKNPSPLLKKTDINVILPSSLPKKAIKRKRLLIIFVISSSKYWTQPHLYTEY
jgi:hypothetical protein